jgi:hypothetical protein
VRAYQEVDSVGYSEAKRRAAGAVWWLDVEILNSWQTLEEGYGPTARSKWNDTYALAGAVRVLRTLGVDVVGIYSTAYQWKAITGGRQFTHDWSSANPVWLAGVTSARAARVGCGRTGFTGGEVRLTQYLALGFDANQRCV